MINEALKTNTALTKMHLCGNGTEQWGKSGEKEKNK